jgi:hypothetical protein
VDSPGDVRSATVTVGGWLAVNQENRGGRFPWLTVVFN